MYIDSKSLKLLVAFMIILSAFFIYFIVSEGQDNDKGIKDRAQAAGDRETSNIRGNITDAKLNKTIASLDSFIKAWYVKQIIDNLRFNTTLSTLNQKKMLDDIRFNETIHSLNQTYALIVGNQKLIINLSNFGSHNSQSNLNLTKFNRAALVDINHVMREIAKQLNITGLKPFNSSQIS